MQPLVSVICPKCRANVRAILEEGTDRIMEIHCTECTWKAVIPEMPRAAYDVERARDRLTINRMITHKATLTVLECPKCHGPIFAHWWPTKPTHEDLFCPSCNTTGFDPRHMTHAKP